MRFDDRLQTVMQGDMPNGLAAAAQYRQLVDILGQARGADDSPAMAAALARIHQLRAIVAPAQRRASIDALAGRLVSPALVHYLSADEPEVANAAIRAARLSDAQWADLVPRLSVRARGMLRHRRDLSAATIDVLACHGVHDLALPAAEQAVQPVAAMPGAPDLPEADDIAAPAPAPMEREHQSIGDIVRRIEAFRQSRAATSRDDNPDAAPMPIQVSSPRGEAWHDAPELPLGDRRPDAAARDPIAVTIDANGRIITADRAPIGALYGIAIAAPAVPGDPGCDAAVASAFARRMPIRAGHMHLADAGPLSGRWRIDAEPLFDRQSGRFTGYRGLIRRPRSEETAIDAEVEPTLAGSDGLRQIVHELRTPLNAILGFAEIIDQQLFGPVSPEYRALATRIAGDARHLLGGFDDLDTALRLERRAIDDPEGETGIAWLVERLNSRLARVAGLRGSSLAIRSEPGADRPLALSHIASDRLIVRLVGALLALTEPGETLAIAISEDADRARISCSRPERVQGLGETALFDADQLPRNDGEGPLLGLGFSLRLVRNLAAMHGGALDIDDAVLCLTLPLIGHSQDEGARSAE